MFRAAKAIFSELKAKGLDVEYEEIKDVAQIYLDLPVKNGGNYRLVFICTEEDFVSIRTYGVAHLETGQVPKIFPMLNYLNSEELCIRFFCDSDNDLIVAYEYPVGAPSPEATAFDMLTYFSDTIDRVYPLIMRALWSE